jgi:glycosyltransferase 2 family protein
VAASISKAFSFRRWILPLLLSFGVAAWFIHAEFASGVPVFAPWRAAWPIYAGGILVFVGLRYAGSMIRLRQLSLQQIGWKASFQVITLWEFATALSPGFIGAAAPALYLVHKEGIGIGRTTAIVFMTSLLDELFFILMLPLFGLILGWNSLLPSQSLLGGSETLHWYLALGYAYMLVLALIILLGFFFNPLTVRLVLVRLFSLRWLKRWQDAAFRFGDELAVMAGIMRRLPLAYWLRLSASTMLIWFSRFALVNMVLMLVQPVGNQLLLLGRQVAMWVILLISPTPGSSGAAELFFVDFLSELGSGGEGLAGLALIWRAFSFYLFLILGAMILPIWLRRVVGKRRDHGDGIKDHSTPEDFTRSG